MQWVIMFVICKWVIMGYKATAVRKLARDGVASKRSIIHAMLGLF